MAEILSDELQRELYFDLVKMVDTAFKQRQVVKSSGKRWMKLDTLLNEYVDVSKSTIQSWVNEGFIHKTIKNGNTLYDREEIDRQMQKCQVR